MDTWSLDWSGAAWGGLAGAIAMTAFWHAARAAGWMRLDWTQLLGTFFYPPGRRAGAVGLVWHLMTGLLLGVVYAVALAQAGFAPDARTGLALGAIHAAVALAMLRPLRLVHPARTRRAERPSLADRALYALGYPLFGLAFGATYTLHAAAAPTPAWLAVLAAFLAALVVALASAPADQGRFAAASPSADERRQALVAAYEAGRLSRDELEAALADWARDEGV